MTASRDVLILSKRGAGGVRQVADIVQAKGYRSVLLSAEPDDRNRPACDVHVVVDWDRDQLPALAEAARGAGVVPAAIVNMVEPLIPWQVEVATHYGLPGGAGGLQVLASKLLVRQRMARLGCDGLRFTGGPAGKLAPETVDYYPVMVKPSRDSGASRLVRRAETPAELAGHLDTLAREPSCGIDFEVIVEEYVAGTEFSIDGPVLGQQFHGLFVVEKLDHDERRHHDFGLLVSPPVHHRVAAGAAWLVEAVSRLCQELALDDIWLHVEGRVRPDGSAELVEINPRPGGRMYRSAMKRRCQVDACEFAVELALGRRPAVVTTPPRPDELIGMFDLEATEPGTVQVETDRAELLALPGVLDARISDGYRVGTLEQENMFVCTVLAGADLASLRAAAARVAATLRFQVTSSDE